MEDWADWSLDLMEHNIVTWLDLSADLNSKRGADDHSITTALAAASFAGGIQPF